MVELLEERKTIIQIVDINEMTKIKFIKPAYLGLASGSITCAYFFIFYALEKQFFFNPLVFWGSFLILLSAFGAVVFQYQNQSFPFIIALRSFFLIFFLNSAFYNFFYFLMTNYIDVQLIDIQYSVIKKGLESNAILSGSEQQTAWKISKKELADNLKAGTIFFSFMQGLPAGFMLSLLASYIFKKD